MLQILRVVPYSATQLYSYEVLKKRFQNEKGELSLSARLAAGGLAGMTATLVHFFSLCTCFAAHQCSFSMYSAAPTQNLQLAPPAAWGFYANYIVMQNTAIQAKTYSQAGDGQVDSQTGSQAAKQTGKHAPTPCI